MARTATGEKKRARRNTLLKATPPAYEKGGTRTARRAASGKDRIRLQAIPPWGIEVPPPELNLEAAARNQYARNAIESTWEITSKTADPVLARAAFDSVRLAVLALIGETSLPPPDCLMTLRQLVLRRPPPQNSEADLRELVHLVADREGFVRRSPGQGPIVEGPLLCAQIKAIFGTPFAKLTADHCTDALAKLVLPNRRLGQRTAAGVAAGLILTAKAWGYAPGTGRGQERLLKDIDNALRGRARRNGPPKRPE